MASKDESKSFSWQKLWLPKVGGVKIKNVEHLQAYSWMLKTVLGRCFIAFKDQRWFVERKVAFP